ncbi:MAG TPA: helix-turn-helix transcriptional regulator, partial [Christiangramia sp.]|nr:helix-turn-helix transcriptional regulator [Christiangramia sp.]
METRDLAKRLKNFRAKRGMSQEYLAEESRVSLRTIQRIENQESQPTGETVKRIAVALGVEINELTGSIEFAETDDLDATI